MTVESQLVDARNWADLKPILLDKMSRAGLIGLDLETWDEPHEALAELRKSKRQLIFDVNRTTIAGFSLFFDGDDVAYYFNMMHADGPNRLAWPEVKQLLNARPESAYYVAHNAPFEICMTLKAWDYPLDNIICTLQMAVSAYGPDEYDLDKFLAAGLGGISNLRGAVSKAFRGYDPDKTKEFTEDQEDLIGKVCAKQSTASHSYNGFISQIAYGYGLKKAVKSFFGVQMRTFQETLGNAAHMGELTGEQVCAYGADDAYWAIRLFHRLLQFMQSTNPAVIKTFFEQENPMAQIYGKLWADGIRVNEEGIRKGREIERAECANILRKLKTEVAAFLPFPEEPNARLLELEKWYSNYESYRSKIRTWAEMPNEAGDYAQVAQVNGAVISAWSAETGNPYNKEGPNFTHYMVMRTLLYDLLGERPMRQDGKVQSDGENRGRLIVRIQKRMAEEGETEEDKRRIRVIELINQLAGVEQRMKLYLTPYTKLVDPQTGRLYPTISSRLATRRMASENPNTMQLAKRGESTYVRGFFLPDNDEHMLVSIDWTQIELVLIGELSGDPGFAEAYGQLPYKDLHLGAAADVLAVLSPAVDEPLLKRLHTMTTEEVMAIEPRLLTDIDGNRMTPDRAKKYWRTELGKGSNFNYWYSGALSTVGQKMGWSADQMWKATDNYRSRFSVAEAWRQHTLQEAQRQGYITLPDNHRRVRIEATPWWGRIMGERFKTFGSREVGAFGFEVCRRIKNRAGNQAVNAKIQGTCSTLAKRSILRVDEEIRRQGFDANFKIPVHDELVWSVNKREVPEFIRMAKHQMCNHPDIISRLVADATAAVGLTFEPYHPKRAPLGQIELDEAPALPFVPKDKVGGHLDDDEIRQAVEWLDQNRYEKAA